MAKGKSMCGSGMSKSKWVIFVKALKFSNKKFVYLKKPKSKRLKLMPRTKSLYPPPFFFFQDSVSQEKIYKHRRKQDENIFNFPKSIKKQTRTDQKELCQRKVIISF